MSTTATDYAERLNLAEIVSRIERQQAETRKFAEEAAKLAAEERKLSAESVKLRRDTNLAPWIVVGGIAGGILTAATLLLRALGVLT